MNSAPRPGSLAAFERARIASGAPRLARRSVRYGSFAVTRHSRAVTLSVLANFQGEALASPDLRDIHLPPAPSWWPPAPGWWLLALIVGVLAFLLVRWARRRARARRWRRRIQAELDRIAATHAVQPDLLRLATELSQLLRRAARLIEPQAVALRDEAWLGFLDQRLPPAQAAQAPFTSGAGRALLDAPYRRADDPATTALDASALLDLARSWLAHALPRRCERA